MGKPSEADHPAWKKAMTYRELRDELMKLTDEELEEAVAIEEPFPHGGSIHLPISKFSRKSKPELGVGPYLIREAMRKPEPQFLGHIQL
jgi:hypothetical protein